MEYPVTCECGKTHQVPGSAAGTSILCDCRRTVEVPSFAKLKASVGESSLSADFEIEQMLQREQLPIEKDCVVCSRTTTNRAVTTVVCEQQRELNRVFRWYDIFMFLGNIWFALLYLYRTRDSRTVGVDRVFSLPIRVCPECQQDLKSPKLVRAVLERTPIYAGLLEKYPNSKIHFRSK